MRTLFLVWALCVLGAGRRVEAAPTDFKLPSGDVLTGALLEDIGALGSQVSRVRAATRSALGVEIGRVPVHIVTLEDLRTLHAEVGGRLPPRWSLGGFELDGHVFVRRALGGIPDEVLIHECLHALSRRFANEAQARGVRKFVEGSTEYLTQRALAARPTTGLVREKKRVYVAFTRFADAVATLVGEASFQQAYFTGGFEKLAQRVDAVRRDRRILLSAALALERDGEQAALEILTGR